MQGVLLPNLVHKVLEQVHPELRFVEELWDFKEEVVVDAEDPHELVLQTLVPRQLHRVGMDELVDVFEESLQSPWLFGGG